jgi:hypothetical protein
LGIGEIERTDRGILSLAILNFTVNGHGFSKVDKHYHAFFIQDSVSSDDWLNFNLQSFDIFKWDVKSIVRILPLKLYLDLLRQYFLLYFIVLIGIGGVLSLRGLFREEMCALDSRLFFVIRRSRFKTTICCGTVLQDLLVTALV